MLNLAPSFTKTFDSSWRNQVAGLKHLSLKLCGETHGLICMKEVECVKQAVDRKPAPRNVAKLGVATQTLKLSATYLHSKAQKPQSNLGLPTDMCHDFNYVDVFEMEHIVRGRR